MADRRYAIIGAGTRAVKTYLPLFPAGTPTAGFGTLVGVGDTDQSRLDAVTARWSVPVYRSEHVEPMLADARPDVLVITTPDHVHAAQIQAALAADVSVLVEKPMAVTAAQAAAVVSAEAGARGSLLVAHNMRYLNLHQEIKRLLTDGHIGVPVSVAMSYRLAPAHGRSYFLRWHRQAAASGGLQITKSCHHFDLLNWWLADRPAEVTGWTRRAHYRAASRPGADERLVPSDADIADEIDAVLRYRSGAVAQYSLSARAAWEGYTLTIRGTDGELTTRYEVVPPNGQPLGEHHDIQVSTIGQPVRHVAVPREPGGHSGADVRMLADLLDGGAWESKHAATAVDGAYAVAIGDAVSRSAATGGPVALDSLLAGTG